MYQVSLLSLIISSLRLSSCATVPSSTPSKQQPFLLYNPYGTALDTKLKVPSIQESAAQARRILRQQSIGVLSTVFPSPESLSVDIGDRPSTEDLAGSPIGLPDYYAADCEPSKHPGDPTFLAISIATSFRNWRAGSNVSLTITDPGWQKKGHESEAHETTGLETSPASKPRFALIGTVERLTEAEVRESGVENCFLERHADARAWTPGNEVHESWWARLKVERIYWVGGFGDRAYIGWIPFEDWRGALSITNT